MQHDDPAKLAQVRELLGTNESEAKRVLDVRALASFSGSFEKFRFSNGPGNEASNPHVVEFDIEDFFLLPPSLSPSLPPSLPPVGEYSDMVAHLSATRQKMEEIEREKFNMAEELARKEKVRIVSTCTQLLAVQSATAMHTWPGK